jgi:hypothetical protein
MNNGGPAFPTKTNENGISFATQEYDPVSRMPFTVVHAPGMDLRDYFAGKALPAKIADAERFNDDCRKSGSSSRITHPEVAESCYSYADAMLTARDAKGSK